MDGVGPHSLENLTTHARKTRLPLPIRRWSGGSPRIRVHAAEENVCARVTVDMSGHAGDEYGCITGRRSAFIAALHARIYPRIHESGSSIRRSGPRTPERLTFLSFAGLTLKNDEGNYGGKCLATV